jgi:hypothetical protein
LLPVVISHRGGFTDIHAGGNEPVPVEKFVKQPSIFKAMPPRLRRHGQNPSVMVCIVNVYGKVQNIFAVRDSSIQYMSHAQRRRARREFREQSSI